MTTKLPSVLARYGCVLMYHPPEDDTPLPWAVYVPIGDDDEDIMGAGETAEAAISEACDEATKWDLAREILAGESEATA